MYESQSENHIPAWGYRVIGVAMICLAILFWWMVGEERERTERHAQKRRECESLNPKYGKLYAPKSGPYQGVVWVAVDFSDETVGLKVPTSTDSPKRFFCGDLREVPTSKPKYQDRFWVGCVNGYTNFVRNINEANEWCKARYKVLEDM